MNISMDEMCVLAKVNRPGSLPALGLLVCLAISYLGAFICLFLWQSKASDIEAQTKTLFKPLKQASSQNCQVPAVVIKDQLMFTRLKV